jgi:catechol 2,3-dioxygenase-like lactoylglutathione lyase family enzyme
VTGLGHIDLRVSDIALAEAFYDELLPALGFTQRYHGAEWRVWAKAEPPLPATPYFGITESKHHRPNENRIAFWVGSREEVERIAAIVSNCGGRDVSGPKEMPSYGPGYWAVFFADPSGNPLEVYVRPG